MAVEMKVALDQETYERLCRRAGAASTRPLAGGREIRQALALPGERPLPLGASEPSAGADDDVDARVDRRES